MVVGPVAKAAFELASRQDFCHSRGRVIFRALPCLKKPLAEHRVPRRWRGHDPLLACIRVFFSCGATGGFTRDCRWGLAGVLRFIVWCDPIFRVRLPTICR